MTELREHPEDSVVDLMQRCHAALQKSRGVVLSLASFDAGANRMTWLGVGNVDGVLFRANPAAQRERESLQTRGGVVGYQIPSLRAAPLPVAGGDMLVFATDGIMGAFHTESPVGWHPQEAADHILKKYGKETDDALILVACFKGSSS